MSASRNVRVGVFVLLSVVLAVALLAALGVFETGRNRVLFETYVEESAQGLSEGSAVRFRGVPVGSVREISFAWKKYPLPPTGEGRRQAYTRIVFGVARDMLPDGEENLDELVERGLRVHVRNQGITGLRYLDLDFASESARKELLPVSWTPELPYVPAAPSLTETLSRYLEGAGPKIDALVSNLTAAAESIHLALDEGGPAFAESLESIRRSANALEGLASALRDDPGSLLRDSDDE